MFYITQGNIHVFTQTEEKSFSRNKTSKQKKAVHKGLECDQTTTRLAGCNQISVLYNSQVFLMPCKKLNI